MKLLYAALASAATVKASGGWGIPMWMMLPTIAFDGLKDLVFTETENGFQIQLLPLPMVPPFLTVDISEGGSKGKIQYTFDGVHTNEDNYEFVDENLRFWGRHYGDNFAQLGLEVGNHVETADYEDKCVLKVFGSVDLKCVNSIDVSFKNNEKGGYLGSFNVTADVEVKSTHLAVADDSPVKVDLTFKGERIATNMELLKSYELDLESSIKVNNLGKCQALAAGCRVNMNVKMEDQVNDFSMKPKLSLDVMPLAIVGKFTEKDVGTYLGFLRKASSPNDKKSIRLSSYRGWYSVHFTNKWKKSGNWNKALQSGDDVLVLQFPDSSEFLEASSELDRLIKPFFEFGFAIYENIEKAPYLVYYLEELLGKFDDEFDCSGLFNSLQLESDIVAEALGADSFTEFMVESCRDVNAAIVDVFKSKLSRDEFKTLFGGFF